MKISYLYDTYSVRKIMFLVIVACIPAIITKCYFFGSGTLIEILFSIIIALLLEFSILKLRFKKIKINLFDNSAILTAVLFGVSIPSLLPWWMLVVGMFFSIIITKHLYGGIGQNVFNPAMVGYVVLLISFPVYMNNWNERDVSRSFLNDFKNSVNIIFLKNYTYSVDDINSNISIDTFTEATPLNDFKIRSHFKKYNSISKNDQTFKMKAITVQNSWKYINISFFLGGIFLFFKKIICWRIPISFFASLGFLSVLMNYSSNELFIPLWVHFFSGGTMICAFFIATDPVTTACTNIGKIIFGVIIGCLVWIIRDYSDYPDAIAFSVLFANMTVPLIDYYTKTTGYGHKE